ncbi:hypothetical protein C8J57DRAFT_1546257 [Mycena rebaudengoi]|nr:hypothetical protein C8J57DRAFT_1546257 [Mycena rebaudengoi]
MATPPGSSAGGADGGGVRVDISVGYSIKRRNSAWPEVNARITPRGGALNLSSSIHPCLQIFGYLHGRTPQNHTPRQPFSTSFWKISRLRTEALLMDTSDACSTLWAMPVNTGCSESTTAYSRTHASSACSALDLPLTEGWRRCALSDAELSHLAVSWNIWATFPRECGALRPECLYLIWDGTDHTRAHAPPATLAHFMVLAVYAPADLGDPAPCATRGVLYQRTTCASRAYVADHMPSPRLPGAHILRSG